MHFYLHYYKNKMVKHTAIRRVICPVLPSLSARSERRALTSLLCNIRRPNTRAAIELPRFQSRKENKKERKRKPTVYEATKRRTETMKLAFPKRKMKSKIGLSNKQARVPLFRKNLNLRCRLQLYSLLRVFPNKPNP